MILSVFYDHLLRACEQTGLPLSVVLAKTHSFGIDAVECDIEHIREGKDEMKALLEQAKLSVASVYGFFDFGNTFHEEEANAFIDDAVSMGAKKVLVVPGFVDKADSNAYEQKRSNMAHALNIICDYAESKDVVVTLEDFDNDTAPFSTDEQLLWFMERVPKLRCTFDTGNFKYQEIDELKAFELLKSKIVHVHCKDRSLAVAEGETPCTTVKGTDLYTSPVGYGCIQMKEILNRLQSLGYNGVLAIEHFGAQNQLAYIEQSAKWLLAQS